MADENISTVGIVLTAEDKVSPVIDKIASKMNKFAKGFSSLGAFGDIVKRDLGLKDANNVMAMKFANMMEFAEKLDPVKGSDGIVRLRKNFESLFDPRWYGGSGNSYSDWANDIRSVWGALDAPEMKEALKYWKTIPDGSLGKMVNQMLGIDESKSKIGQAKKYAEEYKKLFDSFEGTSESGMFSTSKSSILGGIGGSEKVKKVRAELSKVDKIAQKTTKSFASLGRAIKRVLLYRAIRAVISVINKGLTDGVKNIAQYDKALNGLSASKANTVMSSFASSLKSVTNSVGAAVIPMLKALEPLFTNIANKAMAAFNAIGAFFASINGESTYTKAVRTTVDFADSLDKSSSSAKKLKNILLGFDELNILTDKNGSGSSTDYSTMFEEAVVPETASSLAIRMKDILFKWDDLTKEDIRNKLFVGLSTLTGMVLGFAVGGVPGVLFGAVAGLTLGLLADGVTFKADGTIDKDNLYSILYPALLGLLGGIAVFTITKNAGAALLAFSAVSALTFALAKGETKFTADGAFGEEALKSLIFPAVMGLIAGVGTFILTQGSVRAAFFVFSAATALTMMLQGIKWDYAEGTGLSIAQLQNTLAGLALATVGAGIIFGLTGSFASGIIFAISLGALLRFVVKKVDWSAIENAQQKVADYEMGITTSPFELKANGGFVSQGSMFIAGEAGPELVGSINGRTGVINSDQFGGMLDVAVDNIVSAILSGASATVGAVNSIDVNPSLDGVLLARGMNKYNKAEATRRGTSAITIG